LRRSDCPLCAISDHSHRSMISAKRKPASAAVSQKFDQVF